MLRDLFSNRWFMGALIFFILMVVGGTLYLKHVEHQETEKLARNKRPMPPQVPIGDTSQGGHWHGDEWHPTPHQLPERPSRTDVPPPPKPTHTGKLTYHTDLLETHPVEALRQQARELGHWSADHIPPFPPNDHEAADYARNIYIWLHYKHTEQTDYPDAQNALAAWSNFSDALRARKPKTMWDKARYNDLVKLAWPILEDYNPNSRWPTTFTDDINLQSSRPLEPFERDDSLWSTMETR